LIIGKKDGVIEQVDSYCITSVVKGMKTHTIIGGEFAVVQDSKNIAFKTLLGSCVAIMFYDSQKKIKGMNHFLLPDTSNSSDDMKYGLFSVESMLNEMYKLGCKPIVRESDRNLSGVTFECVFDFGVYAEDFRGLYKNAGA
jgi:chemotaxis protein CheD